MGPLRKEVFNSLQKNEKILVAILTIMAFVCGFFAFKTKDRSFLETLYRTIKLIPAGGLEKDYSNIILLEISRWLFLGLSVYVGIRLYLLIIRTSIKALFTDLRDHTIIIGLNDYSFILLKEFARMPVILIGKQSEGKSYLLKNDKLLQFETNDVKSKVFQKAKFQRAKDVYILTENDDNRA